MNILQRNIDKIKIYSEDLAKDLIDSNDESNSYEIYNNFNNQLVVKCQNENGNLIHYTSYYDPLEQAEEIIRNVEFNTNRLLIVCVGIGAGYQIDKILGRKTEKSVVIVIEDNISLLKSVLSIKDYSNEIINKGLYFCSTNSMEKQIKNIMSINTLAISKISYVSFEVYHLKYISLYRSIMQLMEKYKENFLFMLGNDLDDTLLGIENNFSNLVQYIKSPGIEDLLKKFPDIYENKPAIIVSSGPSLDKNVNLLKGVENKALILSCDGSYSTLLKNDILPHSIGSVERIDATYEAFYKNKVFNNQVVLTAPAVVKKGIVEKFDKPQRILSMFKNEAYGKWFNETASNKGVVTCGASVSHMLCGVAMKLRCNPIILIGQDLAYSKEGVSHTSEAEVKEKKDISNVDVYVEGVDGSRLPSTYIWKRFLDIYEDIVQENRNKYEFIDASEGGAKIQGTKVMKLEEAINKYCDTNIVPLISLLNDVVIGEKDIKDMLINAREKTLCEIDIIQELKKRVKKALDDNKKSKENMLIGVNTQEKLDKIYDSIDYVENNIIGYIASAETLMLLFQFPIMLSSHEINLLNTDKFTFESLEANIDIHKRLLDTIENYTEKLINEYKKGMKKIDEEIEKYDNYGE